MYLTEIKHDFNFDLHIKMEEVLHRLNFIKSTSSPLFLQMQNSITFYPNQGRETKLFWGRYPPFFTRTYTFLIDGIVSFTWKKGSHTIHYNQQYYTDNKILKYWLLHTFLPLYYLLEEKYNLLHAGAVQIEDKVALFVAPSYGGKSTLTHYFLQKGHTFFSDDKLAIIPSGNKYNAIPSYPYLREYRQDEDLGRYTEQLAMAPLEIACIYHLVKVDAKQMIKIRELKGIDKFKVIEMSNEIKLPMLKERKMTILYTLVEKFDVYEIEIPQSYNRLEDVYVAVVEHNSMLNKESLNIKNKIKKSDV